MNTLENLKTAFAGESQANRKYLAFAKKAEEEGKSELARLFRAAAEGETIHALKHLRAMGAVKSSLENIKSAIEGEGYEFEEMYPQFIEEAEKESNEPAKISFYGACEVEKVHHRFFGEAQDLLEKGEDLPKREYYVCSVCGNLVADTIPEKCPICSAPREKFYKAE